MTPEADRIYEHLRDVVIPSRSVTTYQSISNATGVPVGQHGEVMGQKLDEIHTACDVRSLPPITSLAVREAYDPAGRHGMTGPGYCTAEGLRRHGARPHDPRFGWWVTAPPPGFDRDLSRWQLQTAIESHQDLVWNFSGTWPVRL